MSAAWATVTLMGVGGGLTWCTFVAKLLWNFRGKWDDTNSTLTQVRNELRSLSETDKALESKLERHLTWHENHPEPMRRGR